MSTQTIILNGTEIEVSSCLKTHFRVSTDDLPFSDRVVFAIKGLDKNALADLNLSAPYEIVYENKCYRVQLVDAPQSSSVCFEGQDLPT